MQIDPQFPANHQVIGKHRHADGAHFHLVWGPGRVDPDTAANERVAESYRTRGEEIVPLGVHGTAVAVDWDSCVADGACIEACPVLINPLEIIVELKRYVTMEESAAPPAWNNMYQNIETNFAPWKFPPGDRFNWAKE